MHFRNFKLTIFILFFVPISIWSITPSIAVYQYYTPDEESFKQYSFLSYTITDTIHQELLNENNFFIVEKSQIEHEAGLKSWDTNDIRDINNKIELSRQLECDYFIWGYYILEQDQLVIFNYLVETASGRTLKISKMDFSKGPEIFDEVELFTKSFTLWINTELPDREIAKEVVYVEKPQLILTEIGIGSFYNIIISPFFSDVLGNGIGGVLDINLYPKDTDLFYFGVSIPITMLKTNDITIMDIDVLNALLLVRAGIDFEPHESFHIQIASNFGIAFLFGYKDTEVLSYARPSFGTELNLGFYPLYLSKKEQRNPNLISIQLGVTYQFVYDTYESESNHLLQPKIEFSLNF